ncbi:hypothetical protein SAMN05216567_1307 [Variovorax sp. OK605]|jgi:hypothetical protein|uniref:hypothetical protein n=1 Tax=Variovorax sp. OK605 TaxID=1855317 RepID=UPI0008EFF442|nr:hypothetical protein [Variovorax sp. OK605]SFQ72266.1 hypothetical protein SAMN05216567_1307 [Variovorax sp. OK605]
MTPFDWLWDWRTLIALALGDAVLLAMFFAWDAKHLAFLTVLTRQQRTGPEERGAFPRGMPGSGT